MNLTSTSASLRPRFGGNRSPFAKFLTLPIAALALLAPGPGAWQVLGQTANARPPERLSFQGFLVDGDGGSLGAPSPRNYDIVFRIFGVETGGDVLWAERQTVTVDQGHFSVLLGEGVAVGAEARPALSTLFKGPSASERHVQITVAGIGASGGDATILPRLQLLSSPYAFLSEQSTKIVRSDTGGDLLTSSDNQVTVHGLLSVADSLTATNFIGSGAGLSGVAKTGDLTGLARLAGGNTFTGPQSISGNTTVMASLDSSHAFGTWLALGNTTAGGRFWQLISTGSGNGEGAGKLLIGYGLSAGGTIPRMTLQDNGFVGIGTSFPGSQLQVNGGIRARGGAPGGSGVNNNGYAFAGGNGDTDSGMFSSTDGAVDFYANSNKLFSVKNNYVEILNPVNQTKSVRIYRGDEGVAQNGGDGIDRRRGLILELHGTTNHNSHVRASWNGDSNWDFNSDRKLKKDIEDAEPMLERALQVPVRRYRWKDEESRAEHKLGVIAQEVRPLFPDLVGEFREENGETTLMVGYGDFALIAVKALQEFKAQHDAEIDGLRTQVTDLSAWRQTQEAAETARREEVTALHDRLASLEKLLRETVGTPPAKPEAAEPATRVANRRPPVGTAR